MIAYPAFAAALAGRDVQEVARAAGLPAAELIAIAAGGWAAPRADRPALALALGIEEAELFRLAPELEEALSGAPSRFVTDPAALRIVDRPRSGAA